MTYAAKADIEKLYGTLLVQIIADLEEDGTPSDAAIVQACEQATSEIDSYVAVQYALPFDPVPKILVQIAVDMAVYRLSLRAGPRTTEMRIRYEDALKFLEKVAAGKAQLVSVPGDLDGDGDVDEDDAVIAAALKNPFIIRTARS